MKKTRLVTGDGGAPPRKHATLDHWVGPMSHTADGASTDPKMQDACAKVMGGKKSPGAEPPQRSV